MAVAERVASIERTVTWLCELTATTRDTAARLITDQRSLLDASRGATDALKSALAACGRLSPTECGANTTHDGCSPVTETTPRRQQGDDEVTLLSPTREATEDERGPPIDSVSLSDQLSNNSDDAAIGNVGRRGGRLLEEPLRLRLPSLRSNTEFNDSQSPHYRILHGHTLAQYVPFLQRGFDRVVLELVGDAAWRSKLSGRDAQVLLPAMVALHAEYVATVLLEAWTREHCDALRKFGTFSISTSGYSAVHSMAAQHGRVIESLLVNSPTSPDDVDAAAVAVPSRPGESWDEGSMSKKQRMCTERVQGIGENPHWEVFGGTPADVLHARVGTATASVLDAVRMSVTLNDAGSRDAFLDLLVADTSRWQLLDVRPVENEQLEELEVTCVFVTRETFHTATRSQKFREVAARVQSRDGLDEDLVTAACWLLSSSAIAASPLTTVVCVRLSLA